jgi:hypothetical protein
MENRTNLLVRRSGVFPAVTRGIRGSGVRALAAGRILDPLGNPACLVGYLYGDYHGRQRDRLVEGASASATSGSDIINLPKNTTEPLIRKKEISPMNNYVTKNAWAARPKKGGGLLVLT